MKLREWWSRLLGTFGNRDRDVEEELRFHTVSPFTMQGFEPAV